MTGIDLKNHHHKATKAKKIILTEYKIKMEYIKYIERIIIFTQGVKLIFNRRVKRDDIDLRSFENILKCPYRYRLNSHLEFINALVLLICPANMCTRCFVWYYY